jgi:hypothetical protein
MESKLLARTKGLLEKKGRKLGFQRVADESGLGYEWIRQLYRGAIHDPGVRKVEALHNYLRSVRVR